VLDLGVLSTCAELGIPVIAYSPLGHDILTGHVRSRDNLDQCDYILALKDFLRRISCEFTARGRSNENAQKKGIAPSQLVLSWIKEHEAIIPGLQIIPVLGPRPQQSSVWMRIFPG
ncbi:hypothetical protein V1507DRAFT_491755, partial [Lipomyces tetrasporus]